MYSDIFIISGPSGAGEDSVIDGLAKTLPIERVVTTTTRDPRPGESQGHPYYFTTKEDFKRRIGEGDFVEYALQYNDNLYGVTQTELDRVANSGNIGVWKMEYKGVEAMKKKFPSVKAIFLTVESLDILESRIKRRDHASDEFVRERMEYTKEWLQHVDSYDFTVVNVEGKLDETIEKVKQFILAHHESKSA